MPPLKTLLISDGRPGHVSLSEGIVAAIARRRTLEVERLELERPRIIPARLLCTLVNRGVAPANILQRVYGIDPARVPRADLIVSAGGDTLAANIAFTKLSENALNVFYGSLRRYQADDFALVLNSYARYADHPRYLVTLKPNKLDADEVDWAAPALDFTAGQPPARAGLLLGGETKGMAFGNANWQRIAGFLRATHAQHGTRWMVSNSRRTPDAVSDIFETLASEAKSPIERFIDVRNAGRGKLQELFSFAQAVAVTADSSSMLSEAIWVRRPVIAIAPPKSEMTADEQDYRKFLSQNGWTATLTLDDLSPQTWHAALSALTPIKTNPLDLLATELEARLPQVFARS